MADPLSITASVVGIIVPALHGTRLLKADLQQLSDAPKTIKRLTDDVQSVRITLELLRGLEEIDWNSLGQNVAEQSKATISSCTQACELFRADLRKWTRHSEDGKLTWLDRVNVGFFKKDQPKAMSEQLQSCKLAINLIVGVATLYNSVRNSHVTEDIKKTTYSGAGSISAYSREEYGLIFLPYDQRRVAPGEEICHGLFAKFLASAQHCEDLEVHLFCHEIREPGYS